MLRPYVYSLGVVTIIISFLLIALFLIVSAVTGRKKALAIEEDGSGVDDLPSMSAATASGD